MKQNFFVTCTFAGILVTAPLWAEKIERSDLPRSVQAAITTDGRGAEITSIDRRDRDGKTIYEVTYREGRKATFSDDGTVLDNGDRKKVEVSNEIKLPSFKRDKVELSSLPQAVQDTIKTQVGSGEVVDIDRENRDGKLTYEVEIKKEGKNQDIHIAEDGTLMPPKKVDRIFGSAQGGETTRAQLQDLPESVQSTIRTRAGSSDIAQIDRKTKDGKVVYAVEVKKEGRNEHFFVAEDGSVVESAGGATILEKTENKLKDFGNKVEEKLDALKTKKVTYNELPAAVQQTVQAQAGATPEIVDVDRETRDGRTVYEVEFKRDGINKEIHVAEDGTLIERKQ